MLIGGEGSTLTDTLPQHDFGGKCAWRTARPAPEWQVVLAAEVFEFVDLAVCDLVSAQHKRLAVRQIIGGEGFTVPFTREVLGIGFLDEFVETVGRKSSPMEMETETRSAMVAPR